MYHGMKQMKNVKDFLLVHRHLEHLNHDFAFGLFRVQELKFSLFWTFLESYTLRLLLIEQL